MTPLQRAIRLAAVETERANKLFPDDEREAVYELLRRAKELPDLRKALLFVCASNLIRGEQMPGGTFDWINVETERAKKLHPEHEAQAIIELLDRSREFPDQRTRMVTMSADNTIAVSRLPPE